jgi:hypothetical protein
MRLNVFLIIFSCVFAVIEWFVMFFCYIFLWKYWVSIMYYLLE